MLFSFRHRFCSPETDRPQSYELNESRNYPKMIRKHVLAESAMQHGLSPVVVGRYTRLNYDRQGMLKQFVANNLTFVILKC